MGVGCLRRAVHPAPARPPAGHRRTARWRAGPALPQRFAARRAVLSAAAARSGTRQAAGPGRRGRALGRRGHPRPAALPRPPASLPASARDGHLPRRRAGRGRLAADRARRARHPAHDPPGGAADPDGQRSRHDGPGNRLVHHRAAPADRWKPVLPQRDPAPRHRPAADVRAGRGAGARGDAQRPGPSRRGGCRADRLTRRAWAAGGGHRGLRRPRWTSWSSAASWSRTATACGSGTRSPGWPSSSPPPRSGVRHCTVRCWTPCWRREATTTHSWPSTPRAPATGSGSFGTLPRLPGGRATSPRTARRWPSSSVRCGTRRTCPPGSSPSCTTTWPRRRRWWTAGPRPRRRGRARWPCGGSSVTGARGRRAAVAVARDVAAVPRRRGAPRGGRGARRPRAARAQPRAGLGVRPRGGHRG